MLHYPRLFAIIFTGIILTVSILRVGAFLHGQIVIDLIAIIMLVSLPHGIFGAYGIYKSIHTTLTNSLTTKTLVTIYAIFLLAAILEVGFVQALLWYKLNQNLSSPEQTRTTQKMRLNTTIIETLPKQKHSINIVFIF